MTTKRVWILGTRVDDITFDEALPLIEQYIESRRPHQIVTSNTEFVMMARRDPAFAEVINKAAMVIPDGIGLLWAARLLGQPLREHVRGTDLVERLMAFAAQKGYRVFLLGAAPGVAEMAAANLTGRHPDLAIAGCYTGSPHPQDEAAIAQTIHQAGRVDILLVAYGAPAQDKWIARNLPRLGVPVAVGVGGVFDFMSGRVKRAPGWVRRLELEWLYRLVRQH